MRNRDILGRNTKFGAAPSRKAQAALALAVSLWIANGGVASAENKTVWNNTTIEGNESANDYKLGGQVNAPKGEGIRFTVEEDGKVKSISGNSPGYAQSSGNTVIVKKGGSVGIASDAIIGGLSNNEVSIEGTVTGNAVTGNVYGGKNQSGNSKNNHVVVKGTVSGGVYGGYGKTATDNTVEILGGKVTGTIYGGGGDSGSTTTNNTVILKGATVNEDVYGGGSESDATGNTLIVSGTNTVGKNVARLQTIKLAEDLEWDGTNAVLTAGDYLRITGQSSIALDISEASALTNRTASGTSTMTLIKATDDNCEFEYKKFSLSTTGDEITTDGVTVKSGATTAGTGGVTIGYNSTHTVAKDNTNKAITYTVANSPVNNITLGTIAWNADEEVRNAGVFDGTGYDFSTAFSSTNIMNGTVSLDTTNFKLTVANEAAYKSMAPGASMTLINNATGLTGASGSYGSGFDYTVANGTKLDTWVNTQYYIGKNYAEDTAHADKMTLDIGSVYIKNVDLAGWDSTKGAFEMPNGWKSKDGQTNAEGPVPVTAAGFTAPTITAGTSQNIITTNTANFFSDDKITGALKYAAQASSTDADKGVTLTGSESKGVKAAEGGKNLVYARSNFNVNNISFGKMTWGTKREADTGYDYTGATVNLDGLTFSNPEAVADATTILLQANSTFTQEILTTTKNISYGYSPVDGVTVNGIINGSYKTESNAIKYTATANKADKLTFGNVEWKDTGALMERPTNITFAGAAVDTSNINFTNISELEANKEMTLVAGWDGAVGTITGSKYKVGSTLQGEGKASLEGSNLIFRTDTTAEKMEVQEQTHNTVMGAEVGMAALSAGNDFIASASEGLATPANVGADGVSSFATMGGGSMRQETGSHVDTHTWNAILALGHKNEKERGTMEYGAFFEYGTGNYTTHNGDERGDGSMHYTGGGLLAKWTAKHGLYVEGSLRAGSVHDDARNVLRDVNGVPYSYETNAPYWGAHIGVGKEIALADGNTVDVYGKYYFNRRSGVSFNAGGHYDLDAVTSSVIRLGARYTVNRDKWGLYAGAAYEHELDGKATGTADGMAIRGADTSGGSFRGELGATFKPEKEGPLTLDFNLTGFAGKKQGLTGGVSVSLMF